MFTGGIAQEADLPVLSLACRGVSHPLPHFLLSSPCGACRGCTGADEDPYHIRGGRGRGRGGE